MQDSVKPSQSIETTRPIDSVRIPEIQKYIQPIQEAQITTKPLETVSTTTNKLSPIGETTKQRVDNLISRAEAGDASAKAELVELLGTKDQLPTTWNRPAVDEVVNPEKATSDTNRNFFEEYIRSMQEEAKAERENNLLTTILGQNRPQLAMAGADGGNYGGDVNGNATIDSNALFKVIEGAAPDGGNLVKLDYELPNKKMSVGDIATTIRNAIDEKFLNRFYKIGDTDWRADITNRSKNELQYKQKKMDIKDFRKKAAMVGNYDELIENLRDVRRVPNKKLDTKPKVDYYISGRVPVLMNNGYTYYPRLDFEVSKQGEIIGYDIADIKRFPGMRRTTQSIPSFSGDQPAVDNRGTGHATSISQNSENVNAINKTKSAEVNPKLNPVLEIDPSGNATVRYARAGDFTDADETIDIIDRNDIQKSMPITKKVSSTNEDEIISRTLEQQKFDNQTPSGEVRNMTELFDDLGKGKRKFVTTMKETGAKVVKIVKDKLGIDVSGYRHTIDNSAAQHALKKHGNDSIPLKSEDFNLIPDIIKNADTIEVSDHKNRRKLDVITYTKNYGDRIVYMEEIRNGRHQLALNTMYWQEAPKNNTSSYATPQQLAATEPERTLLRRSDGVNNSIIPQNSKNSNAKSHFATETIQNSPEVSSDLKQSVKNRQTTYETTSNAERLAKSEEFMRKNTLSQAESSVTERLNKKLGTVSDQDVSDAILVAKALDAKGDSASLERASAIYDSISKHASKKGQEIQAL